MSYDLITDDDYASLPDDSSLKFVAIETICRRNMTRIISAEGDRFFDATVRTQYMAIVSATAEELGVSDVRFPDNWDNPADGIDYFIRQATSAAARIKVRSTMQRTNDPYSVRLGIGTKSRIELQIKKLREMIAGSDLPQVTKSSLDRKLDELAEELTKARLSFGKAMAILAYVSTTVAATTSFFADAPGAVATITRLIGADKEAEEKEAQRLGSMPVQAALPPPSYPKRSIKDDGRRVAELDDEIPF